MTPLVSGDRHGRVPMGYRLDADQEQMHQRDVVTAPELNTAYEKALAVLGAGLRQQRESRAIGLQDLATKLYFPFEQLEALEAGDPSRLPEPVYVIAQARRVGQALGLGDDARIPGLEQVISNSRQPQLIHPLARLGEVKPERPGPQPSRHAAGPGVPLKRVVASSALACGAAALLVFGWLNWPQRDPAQARVPAAERPVAAPAKPAAPAPAGQLRLSTGASSWLEVTSPDGRSLFRGTLSGSRQFPLGSGLAVIAGRPDLVEVQVGQAPPRPLGRIEQVSWQRFGPDGGLVP